MCSFPWFIAALCGWMQREQYDIIAFLQEEDRVLRAQLHGQRRQPSDDERRRLAVLGRPLGRATLMQVATIVNLRERTRLRLPALVAMPHGAPELKQSDGLERFDAQSWAFVHFLLFGNNGARSPKINEFFRQVNAGTAPEVAMPETIGTAEQLEDEFVRYVGNSIFSFAKLSVDVSVKREGFTQRQLSAAEAPSTLALFHTSMRRPAEAKAAIAAARAAGAAAPDSFLAEAIALERDGKREEAKAAVARAVAGGSTNAYPHYTLARFNLAQKPDKAMLQEQETLLKRAVELNPRHAYALALLAEVRSMTNVAEALDIVTRAVRLDPGDSNHRLSAARILWRGGQHAQALRVVQAALALSTTEAEGTRARELQQAIERDKR